MGYCLARKYLNSLVTPLRKISSLEQTLKETNTTLCYVSIFICIYIYIYICIIAKTIYFSKNKVLNIVNVEMDTKLKLRFHRT